MKTIKQILNPFLGAIMILLQTTGFVFSQANAVPDPNFGTGGQVLTKIKPSNDDIAQSVAIQADGKIVVAGNSFNMIGYSDMPVIRYKKSGKLDRTFNATGKKIIPDAFCNIVAIQADGKIVIGGSKAVGSNTVFGLWRLNADGTTDNTFGTNGAQTVSFSGYVICFAMVIQPDGKILIGGNDGNFYAGHSSLALARLTPSGQLDNTFDGDGKFSYSLTKKSLACQKILLQPDGKIIAAGQLDTIVDPYFRNEFFAMRLNADGSVDPSFGNNGMMRAKNSNSDNCYNAGLLPDGRIVLAGFSQFTGYNTSSALCLKSNGTVDQTFGTSGWVYLSFFNATSSIMYGVAVQGNGKVILAGTAMYSPSYVNAIALARLNSDGTMDATFGNGGMDTSFVSASGMGCNDVVLQPDGKIVITGYKMQTHDYFMTARYRNTPQLQKTTLTVVAHPQISGVTLYPDPVNGYVTTLRFNMEAAGETLIAVYDVNGNEVTAPIHISCEKGVTTQSILLPHNLANGTYICTVKANDETSYVKFQVQK